MFVCVFNVCVIWFSIGDELGSNCVLLMLNRIFVLILILMLCGVFISEMCLFDFNELSSVSYGGVGLDFVVLMVVVVVFLVCCVSV